MSLAKARGAGDHAQGPIGFDFTWHMRRLCEDMARRHPDLGHIQPERVAIGFCQTRKKVPHGLYATLTPLRFAEGDRDTIRRGGHWSIQPLVDASGREMLYILSFYLPRFLDLPFREKLTTVVHELWHISPQFDGDLRRFRGRCYAHGGSQEQFDRAVDRLAEGWLERKPPSSIYDFLHYSFHDLVHRHGGVYGTRVRTPRLYRLG
jgi:hypothetical protein